MDTFGTPLDSYLDPGERLLWSGQPKQGLRLQAGDLFMIPFSLMWGGFALFWEAGVLGLIGMGSGKHATPPIFMAIFGIPFVVIGLYMIFGRFFFDAASRAKTWYGLTDRRAIILKTVFGKSVNSFDLAGLGNLNLVARGDSSGDILFGSALMTQMNYGTNRRAIVPGFYLVPDARRIFDQIRAVQSEAGK